MELTSLVICLCAVSIDCIADSLGVAIWLYLLTGIFRPEFPVTMMLHSGFRRVNRRVAKTNSVFQEVMFSLGETVCFQLVSFIWSYPAHRRQVLVIVVITSFAMIVTFKYATRRFEGYKKIQSSADSTRTKLLLVDQELVDLSRAPGQRPTQVFSIGEESHDHSARSLDDHTDDADSIDLEQDAESLADTSKKTLALKAIASLALVSGMISCCLYLLYSYIAAVILFELQRGDSLFSIIGFGATLLSTVAVVLSHLWIRLDRLKLSINIFIAINTFCAIFTWIADLTQERQLH
jgi:hypothetical protein